MGKFHASLGKQREKLGGHLYNFIKHGKKAGRAFAPQALMYATALYLYYTLVDLQI